MKEPKFIVRESNFFGITALNVAQTKDREISKLLSATTPQQYSEHRKTVLALRHSFRHCWALQSSAHLLGTVTLGISGNRNSCHILYDNYVANVCCSFALYFYASASSLLPLLSFPVSLLLKRETSFPLRWPCSFLSWHFVRPHEAKSATRRDREGTESKRTEGSFHDFAL